MPDDVAQGLIDGEADLSALDLIEAAVLRDGGHKGSGGRQQRRPADDLEPHCRLGRVVAHGVSRESRAEPAR